MSTYGKGRADFYQSGGWNVVCYECGRKRKSSQMRKHWQGYWVCPDHWEPRQEQDFVRGIQDVQTPPWTQPMPADTFVAFNWTEFPDDSVVVDEEIVKDITLATISESIPVTESIEFIRGLHLNDFIPVTDSNRLQSSGPLNTFLLGSVPVNGGISEVPNLTKVIGHVTAEAVPIGESVVINDADQFVDSIAPSDSRATGFNKGLSETVTVSESFSFHTTHAATDTLVVTDLAAITTSNAFSDAISPSDSDTILTNKGVSDTLTVSDSYVVAKFSNSSSRLNASPLNTYALGS